jgi:hypothetical protein
VLFGGNDKDSVFADVCVLDAEAMAWRAPAIEGRGPDARCGHVCLALDERFLLVHGGWDPNMVGPGQFTHFSDLWLLDTRHWAWLPCARALAAAPPSMRARVGHSAIACAEAGGVLFFGGQSAELALQSDLVLLRP